MFIHNLEIFNLELQDPYLLKFLSSNLHHISQICFLRTMEKSQGKFSPQGRGPFFIDPITIRFYEDFLSERFYHHGPSFQTQSQKFVEDTLHATFACVVDYWRKIHGETYNANEHETLMTLNRGFTSHTFTRSPPILKVPLIRKSPKKDSKREEKTDKN